MEDEAIINLYFARSEQAVSETKTKYGRLLVSVAYGILKNMEDAGECGNDTYLKTWNAIPPERPKIFSAFLSRITRNLSLDRYDQMRAAKRGGGEIPVLIDELSECLPDDTDIGAGLEEEEQGRMINAFLSGLKPDARNIFMRRYWFGNSVQEIAEMTGFSVSKVKMSLLRTRNALKETLEKEGIAL